MLSLAVIMSALVLIGTAPVSAASVSASSRQTEDATAEANVNLALQVIAGQYQDFGDYSLVFTKALGNLDHRLRSVSGLYASGSGQTFVVSVRSPSGTTFTVHGDRLRLTRTCKPIGADCKHGTWPGGKTLALAKVPVITAADKSSIRAILTASVNHYAHLLVIGEQALGTTQYANGAAGVAAFNNPDSAASKFRDYQQKYKPASDESFNTAFEQADRYYTAANEPTAITTWRNDMITATSDLSSWVQLAVGWQIREHSTSQLQAAERAVVSALARARRDVDRVIAGK